MSPRTNLTQEELKKVLTYKPETGEFFWAISKGSMVKKGALAGSYTRPDGGCQIKTNGHIFLAHRLAWLYVHGEWPDAGIDHINGVASDNRICNLRPANQSQNVANALARKDNELGVRGVSRYGKKFRVAFYKNQKQIHGGYFDTFEEACAAAKLISKKTHEEFSGYNRPHPRGGSRYATAT